MKQTFAENLFVGSLLAVPLGIAFAGEKVSLWGLPLYVPEMIILFAVLGLFLSQDGGIARIRFPRLDIFSGALVLIAMGLFLSACANDMTWHGYGRMKSWFFFPVVYGSLLSFSLKRKILSMEDVLYSVFLGGVFVGISTVASIIIGGAFSYDQRLHGFFSSPNQLAMLLGTALIMGVFLWDYFRENMRGARSVVLCGIFFLAALILLTQSYTTIFSLLMVFGIGMARYHKKISRKQTAVFFLVLVVCGGILFLISHRKWQGIMTLDARSSLASRGMIWYSALRMIEDHPFIGIGPGNFQKEYIAYQQYFPPYLEWSVPHPHNSLLDMWLEGGLLGFIGFGTFFWYWIAIATRYFRQKNNESPLQALPLVLALYFLLIGLTDVPFLRNDLAYFFVTAFVVSRVIISVSDRSSRHGD